MFQALHISLVAAISAGVYYPQKCLAATTVTVNATASHSIPTTLYGQMFEDINHSGDGGLYAELLQNRAFQQVPPNNTSSLVPWEPINGVEITVIADSVPVSQALPNSLQLTVPNGSSGNVGVSNSGYWGIKVNSTWSYNASLYYRFPSASSFSGTLTVGLNSSSGEILASNSSSIVGSQTAWKQIALTLHPSASASNNNNTFFVTVNGTEAAGETIHFALFSLFPPTYKNRLNGIRIDIAEALAAMNPGFFRFPGGNNIEGYTWPQRWQWNATVGSLLDRPGRIGDWGYVNTDGLGLLEFLQFIEDVGMEPFMGVWSGYSLNGSSVPEDELEPYIQQAKDQINFVIGDPASSAPAALRASLGHPEPFKLQYVEIGNEDFFAAASYVYRWPAFVNALQTEFPNLSYIATSLPFNPELSPAPLLYDVHKYGTPEWFAQNSFYYDGFERNGTKYFEGEYAVDTVYVGESNGQPQYAGMAFPTMWGSASEAAFMTGFERNGDIVFAAAYAPLLQNVNGSEAPPDLVSFDAGSVYLSTSYYVQQLFSLNLGDEYLPSTLPAVDGPAYWSISRSSSSGDVFIKVANPSATDTDLVFELPFSTIASNGTLQLLHGGQNASNTPETPYLVVPVNSTIATGSTLNYTALGYSVGVITVNTA